MATLTQNQAQATETALHAQGVDDVLSAIERLVPDADVRQLASAARRALQGSRPAVRDYVRRYRELTADVLAATHAARPDIVMKNAEGNLVVADVDGRPARAPLAALDDGAAGAVFSNWVGVYGPADGLALDLISRVRATLPDTDILTIPTHAGTAHWDVDDAAMLSFLAAVRQEIASPTTPLDTASQTFDLSETELGALFGVRRQAISQWRSAGIPSSRVAKVTTVASLADLLARKLKVERIPGIARRPAAAYGGLTMLEMITADRHDELLALVRASFDPAQTA
jgi:hypothetical protein